MSKDKKNEKEPVVVVKEIHHHHYHRYPHTYVYPTHPSYPYTQIWCGSTSSGSGQYTVNGSVG